VARYDGGRQRGTPRQWGGAARFGSGYDEGYASGLSGGPGAGHARPWNMHRDSERVSRDDAWNGLIPSRRASGREGSGRLRPRGGVESRADDYGYGREGRPDPYAPAWDPVAWRPVASHLHPPDPRLTYGDVRHQGRVYRPPVPREDMEIRFRVRRNLLADRWLEAGSIRVDVEDGVVTLSGEVGDYLEARYAWDDAWESSGVRGVVSRLEVRPAVPEARKQTSDRSP